MPAVALPVQRRLPERASARAPVEVGLAYPFAPHPVFRGDRPLLLLPRDWLRSSRYTVYRYRRGELMRLEPVATVRAVHVLREESRGEGVEEATIDVDVYPLDFPPEELVVESGSELGKWSSFHFYVHKSRWGDRGALELRLRMEHEGYAPATCEGYFTGLGGDPGSSLTVWGERGFQAAAVVLPGWLTIVGLGEMYDAFVSADGESWEVVRPSRLPSRAAVVYAPEGSYYLVGAWVRLSDAAARQLDFLLPSGKLLWLPLAWRLPGPGLPPRLRELLLQHKRDPEQVELIERVVREVGPKWL